MYNKKLINNFTKNLIMENHKAIKKFIRDFEGGLGDEEAFSKLCFDIDCNKLGIPTQIQEKIDEFIHNELEPMVYEPETVFVEAYSIGTVIDGVRHINTDEDGRKMCISFINTLIETEKRWDNFAEIELKPYLLSE